MYNLWLAFDGTAQSIPSVPGVGIWYMEGGSQTAIDTERQAAYSGVENVAVVPDFVGGEPDAPAPAETSAAPDQYTQALDTIRLAACQPYVRAYFNFLLFDEPRLGGWQSGAYWADRTPKARGPASSRRSRRRALRRWTATRSRAVDRARTSCRPRRLPASREARSRSRSAWSSRGLRAPTT